MAGDPVWDVAMVQKISAGLLSVVTALTLAAAAEPLKTAFGHVPPLSYRMADGRPAGFTVDVLNEAARREGIQLQWVPAGPSLAIEQALQAGAIDIVPGAMVTPDRERMFYVSEPWWFAELSLLTRTADGLVGTDLAGKRLALGSPIYRFLAEKEFPKAIELPFDNAMGAALAVCGGEADAALTMHMDVHDIFFARPDLCRNVGVSSVETNATMALAIMARHGKEAPARSLRRRIDEMALDGTLAKMAGRHPPIPSSGVVRLADNLHARYERRLWRTIALCAILGLAAGAWLIGRLYRDIAARKRAQAELQASQARLARAHRIASLGDWVMDLASGAVDWSDGARQLFCPPGSTPRTGRDAFLHCVVPEDVDRLRSAFADAAAGKVVELDYAIRAPGRGRRYLRQRAEPVRKENNEVIALVGTIQDITEYKELEAKFQQAQKLDSIGRLAGGVAHDFNNLLTVINGYTDMLLAQLPERDASREAAREVRRAGDRAAALTQQLLTFSRRQDTEPSNIDLNAVIADAEKMLGRLVGDDVTITLALDPGAGSIRADAGQICQMLTNFVINSRDAMPGGGHIRIETQNVERGPAAAAPENVNAPSVLLMISDTGSGMDAETLSHIFEPFFTTKAKGRGTGLGLSTVYGIVKQSEGSIEVASEVGRGTTFRVYFPRAAEGAEKNSSCEPPAIRLRGSERVLIVEDEPALRKLIAKTLESSGYLTFEAGNGQEALDAASNHTPPDLIVTDVSMPGMSGIDLARRVVAEHRDTRVLLISGYIEKLEDVRASGFRVLHKPFTPGVLAAHVRAVLDGRDVSEQQQFAG